MLSPAVIEACSLLRYDGWPVAFAGTDSVVFHPALLDLAERDEAHPLVRFTCDVMLLTSAMWNSLRAAQGRDERSMSSRSTSARECLD